MDSDIIFYQDIPPRPDAGRWTFDRNSFSWRENDLSAEDIKRSIFITGCFRSGNNFLLTAYHLASKKNRQNCIHTEKAINQRSHAFVTFRDPYSCISSWSRISGRSIDSCIDYYIRFNLNVLNNIKKITLLDFDDYTKNIKIFYTSVESHTGVKLNEYPSSQEIFNFNIGHGRPMPSKHKYIEEKNIIKNNLKLNKVLYIHNQLKNLYQENLNV